MELHCSGCHPGISRNGGFGSLLEELVSWLDCSLVAIPSANTMPQWFHCCWHSVSCPWEFFNWNLMSNEGVVAATWFLGFYGVSRSAQQAQDMSPPMGVEGPLTKLVEGCTGKKLKRCRGMVGTRDIPLHLHLKMRADFLALWPSRTRSLATYLPVGLATLHWWHTYSSRREWFPCCCAI